MKRFLCVELPNQTPLPQVDAVRIAAQGSELMFVTDENAAKNALKTHKIDLFLCNAPHEELFRLAKEKTHSAQNILVTHLTMDEYSEQMQGHEDTLIDHVIARRNEGAWTTHDFRITAQKLIRDDIFGIEKYLALNTFVFECKIPTTKDRENYNNQVAQFAETCRLGAPIVKAVWGISEEMLMNALFDAPAAAGIERFVKAQRTDRIELEAHEQPVLRYGFDGSYFAVSVRDPFGRLSRSKVGEYAKKVLRRADSTSLIDTKAGGAGLGLFKILFGSHALVCNVAPEKWTEVIAIIDCSEQVRDFGKMCRSIHFFSSNQHLPK